MIHKLSKAQEEWLAARPQYEPCAPPRAGVRFKLAGTLYEDGEFDPLLPMKPVMLRPGCLLVGIRTNS